MKCPCNGCGNYFNWKAEVEDKKKEGFNQYMAEHYPMYGPPAPIAISDDEPMMTAISVTSWRMLDDLSRRPDVIEEKILLKGEPING